MVINAARAMDRLTLTMLSSFAPSRQRRGQDLLA